MIILRLALTLLSTTTLSSGNVNPPTPWTPADLGATLSVWLDAADSSTITLNGSTVSQWRDKSGNARHVAQATAVKQPTYTLAAQNNLNVLSFDGSNNSLFANAATITINQPVHRFIVCKFLTKNFNSVVFDSDTQAAPFFFYNGENPGGKWVWPGGSYGTSDITNSHIHYHLSNNTASYYSIDGATPSGPVSAGANTLQGVRIGHLRGEFVNGYAFQGYVYEVLLVQGTLSDTDRQKIEGYLAWKWGLQANLPISHPYRWDGTLFGYSRLWTPADATTALWLDAADATTITLNGSTVSQWRDKSGNARHANQAVAANQPTYASGGINGFNSVSFNSDDSLLSPPVFASATNATVICVLQHNSLNSNQSIYSTEAGTGGIPGMYLQANAGTLRIYGGTYASGGTYANGQIEVIAFSRGTSTGNLWRGGSQVLTDAAIGTTTTNAGFLLGRLTNGLYGVYEMGEVVALNGQASTTDRQKLEGYLAWKWGTVANLPSNHPYKNGAPTV